MWAVGAALTLAVCFLLCKYAFFSFHQNSDWSFVLFVIGLIVLSISALFNGKKVMICTIMGYIGGFVTGIAFGVDGVDAGGGATNNWWQIWTIFYFAVIIAGVVWEVVANYINKKLSCNT